MVMKSVEFVYFVCLGIKYLSFLIKMSSSIENLPLDKLSRGKCMSLFDPLKCKAGLLTHSLTHSLICPKDMKGIATMVSTVWQNIEC